MVKFSAMGYDSLRNGGEDLKNLIRNFERFCLRHRDKGIPNLMLYIAVGSAIIYVFSMFDPSNLLYKLLCFDRTAILQGQVWRLLTFVIALGGGGGLFSGLLTFLMLFFYYRIGILLEQRLGVFKFNLFYFTGLVLTAAAGMIFPMYVTADSLNLSLILAFAVMYSEAQVLLMYIIPLKMKWLAWFYLIVTVLECVTWRSLLPVVPLLNFLLFFWTDLPNLLPDRWRRSYVKRKPQQNYERPQKKQKPNPNWADGYVSKTGQKPYRHKCRVCGRTDAEYPDLEFRYCSRCQGYHCYCMDHINNHTHIAE